MKISFFISLFVFCVLRLYAEQMSIDKTYLLPEEHPIKSELDQLFSTSRVIFNLRTLRAVGFETSGPRKFTKIIIATHPQFPHYLFKLFLDVQRYEKSLSIYESLVQRVQGAQLIHEEIKKNQWEHLFKVPNKWIYVLPCTPETPSEFEQKRFLLVEDNMQIHPDKVNESIWKSDNLSPEFLYSLFQLLTITGYRDVKPANIPFSLDGKAAFVDTQTVLSEVRYSKMTPYLSSRNQKFWKNLIKNQ